MPTRSAWATDTVAASVAVVVLIEDIIMIVFLVYYFEREVYNHLSSFHSAMIITV